MGLIANVKKEADEKKRFHHFETIVICISMMKSLSTVNCLMRNVTDGFISLVTRMIHVKCFRKWVNAFKYDDIKAV